MARLYQNRSRLVYLKIASPSPLKPTAPEPVAARQQPYERALEHRLQHQRLQSFRPDQSPFESRVAPAGDGWLCLRPGNPVAAPVHQWLDGDFRRLERHGHPVARQGRDHRDRVPDTTLVVRGCALRLQRQARDRAKRAFLQDRSSQSLAEQRSHLAEKQFATVAGPSVAQISNLLYRRIVFGRALSDSACVATLHALRIANP